jgi:hypothetical protein
VMTRSSPRGGRFLRKDQLQFCAAPYS